MNTSKFNIFRNKVMGPNRTLRLFLYGTYIITALTFLNSYYGWYLSFGEKIQTIIEILFVFFIYTQLSGCDHYLNRLNFPIRIVLYTEILELFVICFTNTGRLGAQNIYKALLIIRLVATYFLYDNIIKIPYSMRKDNLITGYFENGGLKRLGWLALNISIALASYFAFEYGLGLVVFILLVFLFVKFWVQIAVIMDLNKCYKCQGPLPYLSDMVTASSRLLNSRRYNRVRYIFYGLCAICAAIIVILKFNYSEPEVFETLSNGSEVYFVNNIFPENSMFRETRWGVRNTSTGMDTGAIFKHLEWDNSEMAWDGNGHFVNADGEIINTPPETYMRKSLKQQSCYDYLLCSTYKFTNRGGYFLQSGTIPYDHYGMVYNTQGYNYFTEIDLACFKSDYTGDYGLINKKGEIVVEPIYDFISPSTNYNVSLVGINYTFNIIDSKGNLLLGERGCSDFQSYLNNGKIYYQDNNARYDENYKDLGVYVVCDYSGNILFRSNDSEEANKYYWHNESDENLPEIQTYKKIMEEAVSDESIESLDVSLGHRNKNGKYDLILVENGETTDFHYYFADEEGGIHSLDIDDIDSLGDKRTVYYCENYDAYVFQWTNENAENSFTVYTLQNGELQVETTVSCEQLEDGSYKCYKDGIEVTGNEHDDVIYKYTEDKTLYPIVSTSYEITNEDDINHLIETF